MRGRRRALGTTFAALIALLPACGPSPAVEPAQAAPAPAPAPAPSAPLAAAPAPALAAAPAPPSKPAAAPTTESRVLSDVWYRVLQDGQPSGWRHVKWTRSTYEGRPTIHDRTEGFVSSTREMGGTADTFEAREYSDLERTEDGLLLRQESRAIQGQRISESTRVWTGSGYEWTSQVAGLEEKRTVSCAEPVPADTEAFLSAKLRAGTVSVGQTYEYPSANFLANRMDTVKLAVKGKESLDLPGGPYDCFLVRETVEGVPTEILWWLDGAGVVRKLRDGRDEVVASTEAKARDLRDGGAVYSITVDADPEMPRCTSLDRAVVDILLEPSELADRPRIPATPFSRELSSSDEVVRVELLAHDAAGDAIALPVKDPAFAKWLERTNLFCWDAPQVKDALHEAVGGEKDAREIVRKILRFVFTELHKGSGPIPQPTAVEILEDGGGDCSEHCVLFVTMCRAAGIPARRLSGYAQVGDQWGSHSFAEVWLGRWIGCDPTTNEFGTKARYIAFGWDDDADSFPGIVNSNVRGRMALRTVEFAESGKSWKTEGLANPSERECVLSGLSLAEPPQGWRAVVGPVGHARISGPGVDATFHVVAGFGDLPADVLQRMMGRGTRRVPFAGRDVLRDDIAVRGHVTISMSIPYRRRMMRARIRVDDAKKAEEALGVLAKILAPTL